MSYSDISDLTNQTEPAELGSSMRFSISDYPSMYWIIVALLCNLAIMSKIEGKVILCLLTNRKSINRWDQKDKIISLKQFIKMEVVFNTFLRNLKALLWLSALALSSVIVIPGCILHSLLQSSKDRKKQEIPQNEKRTVLLTGGPLTKGNIDSKIIFFKGIMTCLTTRL